MIRETSLEAYRSLEDSGALSRRQTEVMTAIHKFFHGRTFTRKQLAVVMQWPINTITPRCKELIERGYLEEQGVTKEDGRSAHLLTIKAAQMELSIAA